MRVLSLFSGGGLGDYGLELAGMEIVAQVEIDEYCRKVLDLRWPNTQKFSCVRDFRGNQVRRIDLVSGGFPCQDISVANTKGRGIEGERSGLWKEMLRIIRKVRPRYVLVENVAILASRGLGTVLGDLAESGYDTEWDCIPASAVGAPHQRDRVWIVAYTNDCGRSTEQREQQKERAAFSHGGRKNKLSNASSRKLAHTDHRGLLHGQTKKLSTEAGLDAQREFEPATKKIFKSEAHQKPERSNWWAVEPNVGRVAHGVAKRVDRLKLLGNGQVVQVVQWIGERIMDFDRKLAELR